MEKEQRFRSSLVQKLSDSRFFGMGPKMGAAVGGVVTLAGLALYTVYDPQILEQYSIGEMALDAAVITGLGVGQYALYGFLHHKYVLPGLDRLVCRWEGQKVE